VHETRAPHFLSPDRYLCHYVCVHGTPCAWVLPEVAGRGAKRGEQMAVAGQRASQVPDEPAVSRSDFPSLSLYAATASRHGQRRYRQFVTANLVFLVAAAALSGLVDVARESRDDPLVAAVVVTMICAMAANFINWHRNYDDDWFQGRALAESVKTASWRYMMRVEPFTSDAGSDREFTRRLGLLLRGSEDLRLESGRIAIDGQQITDRMRDIRRLSVSDRLNVYVRDRLDPQIAWYLSRSQENGALAARWFLASFGAELVALLIALVAFVDDQMIEVVGLIAAIAAAFAAWTQLGRHEELNKTYRLAWTDLLLIKNTVQVETEEQLRALVRASEGAISREHTMWAAKYRGLVPEEPGQ
jgi:hypothetical protein